MTPISMPPISYSRWIRQALTLVMSRRSERYPSASMTSTCDKDICQFACVAESAKNNSYIMLMWLQDVFDPHKRSQAHTDRDFRLLFLDGEESHTKAPFMEACWPPDIPVIILPANLTGRFQLLNFNFFNHPERAYHQQPYDFQIGSGGQMALK